MSEEQQINRMAQAITTLLALLPAQTELLFYRGAPDDACCLGVQMADGTLQSFQGMDEEVTAALGLDTTQTFAAWQPISLGRPKPITDVLLLQGFSVEEGNTLIRIGWLRPDGVWVATHCSNMDGSEEVLDIVTHWAPLPADPLQVQP